MFVKMLVWDLLEENNSVSKIPFPKVMIFINSALLMVDGGHRDTACHCTPSPDSIVNTESETV